MSRIALDTTIPNTSRTPSRAGNPSGSRERKSASRPPIRASGMVSRITKGVTIERKKVTRIRKTIPIATPIAMNIWLKLSLMSVVVLHARRQLQTGEACGSRVGGALGVGGQDGRAHRHLLGPVDAVDGGRREGGVDRGDVLQGHPSRQRQGSEAGRGDRRGIDLQGHSGAA